MLEKNLAQRPDKKDLIDRNILKGACSLCFGCGRRLRGTVGWTVTDDSVAPALQAAKERLQRSQLEVGAYRGGWRALLMASAEQDKLEHALQARPKPEELVKKGILLGESPHACPLRIQR